jgi:hypothetical protein
MATNRFACPACGALFDGSSAEAGRADELPELPETALK